MHGIWRLIIKNRCHEFNCVWMIISLFLIRLMNILFAQIKRICSGLSFIFHCFPYQHNILIYFPIFSWFKRKLDVHVDDFSLDLSMSTVIGLNDLIEDEILPKPLPADILLNGVKLRLIEDRPSVNITSPGPVPIEMEIGKMHIHRNESGVFEIQPLDEDLLKCDTLAPKKERDRETKTLQLVLQQLKLDNDCLKMKLMSAEKSSELNA